MGVGEFVVKRPRHPCQSVPSSDGRTGSARLNETSIRMPRFNVSKAIVPSFSKIENPVETDFFRKKFLRAWGMRMTSQFPGCNPVSIGRHHLPELSEAPYLVSLKSDGVRYSLFLTMRPVDGGPIALLIDRTWTMYEIEVIAPELFFLQTTILEGELVWQQPGEQTLMFLVFDAVVIKGVRLTEQPFQKRLAEATHCTRLAMELSTESTAGMPADDLLEDRVLETDAIAITHYRPTIIMRPKLFVELKHSQRLWHGRNESDHHVDGLILNKASSEYTIRTAQNGSVYKWKPQSTIDLHVEGQALCTMEGPLPAQIHGRRVVILESRVKATEKHPIIEFLITLHDDDTIELFPVRSRPDKHKANSVSIVRSTVQDVVDNIRVDEFCGSE